MKVHEVKRNGPRVTKVRMSVTLYKVYILYIQYIQWLDPSTDQHCHTYGYTWLKMYVLMLCGIDVTQIFN